MVTIENEIFVPEATKDGPAESTKCGFCKDYARLTEAIKVSHTKSLIKASITEERKIGNKVIVIRLSIPRRIRYCPTCGRRLSKSENNERFKLYGRKCI